LVLMAAGLVVWDRMSPSVAVPEASQLAAQTAGEAQTTLPITQKVSNQSIAVLPFVNMSDDPENEYFADGLSEELLNRLAQLPELRVAGRTSSFEYKGQNLDLREIAQNLGVANVLEGSVRRSGDQVRITAQLIQASDGSHLWSQSYDRTLEDVFRIQDEIAEKVAANLDVIMSEERRELMRRVGVRNVDAFVAYQKGWEAFVEAHRAAKVSAALAEANEHFRQATELYPDFSAAWYWQADRYQHVLFEPGATPAELQQAAEEVERLLTAAYEHAQTPQQRAFTNLTRMVFSDDWTGVSVQLERALELQTCAGPNWSEVLYVFNAVKNPAREMEVYLECMGGAQSVLAVQRESEALLLTGRAEAALEQADQAIVEFGQDNWTSAIRMDALLALQRWDDAIAEARLIDLADKRFGYLLPITLAMAGQHGEARELAQRWLQIEDRDRRSELILHSALGDRDRANALAAEFDARPVGHMFLAGALLDCMCGALFDLEVAPNLAARLTEAGYHWPPASPIRLP
ncbi:MAG: hypothetical protein HKN15_01385, partial [Xanthomonadales bacterium]|nr:hypothetical protein [Xanthomonadales bacterium]